jgi:hypothetical protein
MLAYRNRKTPAERGLANASPFGKIIVSVEMSPSKRNTLLGYKNVLTAKMLPVEVVKSAHQLLQFTLRPV